MKLEEILDLWKIDSNIDKTELGDAALNITKLHHKYFQILIEEKLRLRKRDADMRRLKLDKYEFYTQGHTEETKAKGWRLPAKGMILKSDIPMYMDADEELINQNLLIGAQQEKIEFLESIIKNLQSMSFNIRNAIEWTKFTMGS